MTKKELIQELEGIPDDTVIQVWTQWDHTVHENMHVDIITDGPDDEIIQAVHINVFAPPHRPRRKTPPKTNEN